MMPRPPARPEGEKSTREQILDVALELFNASGFEATSLREIAERMKFSKAALYYHFASKDDILLALHLRLHELGRDGFDDIDAGRIRPADWPAVLDHVIDNVLDNRALFILHVRNHAALDRLHDMNHAADNEDLKQRLTQVLTNTDVPLPERVRLACALGAIASGALLASKFFPEASTADMGKLLREAIGDLLGRTESRRCR